MPSQIAIAPSCAACSHELASDRPVGGFAVVYEPMAKTGWFAVAEFSALRQKKLQNLIDTLLNSVIVVTINSYSSGL
jgi:hypothetical protein